MKWMLSFCTLLFVFSLLYRTDGQPNSVRPELLEEVVGLTELQVMEMRSGLLETHGKVLELQARLKESDNPRALQREMRDLVEGQHRQLTEELSPEQEHALASLPSDPHDRRHGFRSRVLETSALNAQQESRLRELLALVQRAEQNERTELRYWAFAGLLLSNQQMIEVKRDLPYRYQTTPRPDNYFALEDLDPSVANRVLSGFLNLESETTASRVRTQQLQKQDVAEGSPEQLAKMREMVSLQAEMIEIREATVSEVDKHLTPEQMLAIQGIPPFGHTEYQQRLAEWITDPQNLNSKQRKLAVPKLTELSQDWKAVEDAIKDKVQSFDDPNARGAMTTMMTTRNKIKPLEARRMEIARELVLTATTEQMETILQNGAEK